MDKIILCSCQVEDEGILNNNQKSPQLEKEQSKKPGKFAE